MTAFSKEEQEEYDFDTRAEVIAAEKGLKVVFPAANQLQIDLDTHEAFVEYERRYECFLTGAASILTRHHEVEVHPSASGLPHRHITISFADKIFTEQERILVQAALNDDPLRVFLNTRRLLSGVENPTRLFEKTALGEDDLLFI